MARPYVFQTETTLYHPQEGPRLFPAGETDPGPAWTDSRGGEPADKTTTASAVKDLIAAQDQIDALGAQLARQDHDLGVATKERDEANLKVSDLEQRAIAAEKGQETEARRATEYMVERDEARSDFQRVSDQLTAANVKAGDLEHEAGKVAGLMEQLDAANQRAADLETENAALKAQIQPLDGDGDGKPGGSKAKGGDKA